MAWAWPPRASWPAPGWCSPSGTPFAARPPPTHSPGCRGAPLDLADLNWERRGYSASGAYGQSKLANLLFTLELQRRLTAAGSPVRALAAHPGYAATNLVRRELRGHPTLVGRSAAASDVDLAMRLWATSAELTGTDLPAAPAG